MINIANVKNSLLFKELSTIGLLANEYVIFGSGIMFIYEIRPWNDFNDIDVVITNKAYEKLTSKYNFIQDEGWKCKYVKLFDDKIELYTGITSGSYDSVEGLINRSVKYAGYNFISLDDLINWKVANGREKDVLHIQMIKEWRVKNNG